MPECQSASQPPGVGHDGLSAPNAIFSILLIATNIPSMPLEHAWGRDYPFDVLYCGGV